MILQLASPVVPFIDVLPNYVGPVEHLRTFGWFSPLDATQSPIIGPSRTVLGYDALLGSLATMTDLSGGLAIAGFILPQTDPHRGRRPPPRQRPPRPGCAGRRVGAARVRAEPTVRAARGRPGDGRGRAARVPGLAVAAEALARRDATRTGVAAPDPGPAGRPSAPDERAGDPWRIGRGVVIGLALGAAPVHPVIGFFAIATVGIAALVRAAALARTRSWRRSPRASSRSRSGNDDRIELPTLALGFGLPVAIAAGIAVGRAVGRSQAAREPGTARRDPPPGAHAAPLPSSSAFAVSLLNLDRVPERSCEALDLVLESSGLLLLVVAAGSCSAAAAHAHRSCSAGGRRRRGRGLTQVLPGDLGFLGDALRFEVPKTVHYWLSAIAAAGAAPALAHLWSTSGCLGPRAVAVAGFVVAAGAPAPRPEPIDAFHLGEHRWSETFAIDLHYAESGFWRGFPDSRTVVDAPRQELLDAVRREIEAGRLRHDTPVLHVARAASSSGSRRRSASSTASPRRS